MKNLIALPVISLAISLAISPFSSPAIAQHIHQPQVQEAQEETPPDVSASPAGHTGHQDHADHKMPSAAPHSPPPQNTTSQNISPKNSGAPNAADAIWGVEAMQKARKDLYKTHGDTPIFWVQGDRIEYRARKGGDGYLWDMQGYYGTDTDKLWVKSEGEGDFGKDPEQAEIQALWSHAIGPFFDAQIGVRQDIGGLEETHLAVGVQGLAPYFLEIDIAAFISSKGNVTARIEGEYDHRLTQKLILQPRAEINLSAQDIPELEMGAGIHSIEAGLRLRYEITPEFGPYIGAEQEWKIGRSRDLARLHGAPSNTINYVAGIRFWF